MPRFDPVKFQEEEFVVVAEPPSRWTCKTGFETGLLNVTVTVCVPLPGTTVAFSVAALGIVPPYGSLQYAVATIVLEAGEIVALEEVVTVIPLAVAVGDALVAHAPVCPA